MEGRASLHLRDLTPCFLPAVIRPDDSHEWLPLATPFGSPESSSAWQKSFDPHTRYELTGTIHNPVHHTHTAGARLGDLPPSPGNENSDPYYQRFLTKDCVLKIHLTGLFLTWGAAGQDKVMQ